MIISDLEHLEVVAEADSVVGGGLIVVKKPKKFVFVPAKQVQQSNVAVVTQTAVANSVAISKDGDAESKANAENNLELNQANVFGSDD